MNATKCRTKPQRSIGIVEWAGLWFLLEITVQKSKNVTQQDFYLATEIGADFGTAFRLEKQSLETEAPTDIYHVCLETPDGPTQCDCRGHGRFGRCKHSEGIAALIKAGKLTPAFRGDAWEADADADNPEDEWARIEAACEQ